MHWRKTRCIGSTAARLSLAVIIAIFALAFTFCPTTAQEIRTEAISASGDTVYRWQINGAQATLFEGDCLLQFDGKLYESKSLLIVTDGPDGQVRNRVVMHRGANENPIAATIVTRQDPTVDAPSYRGPPKQPPELLRYLPGIQDDGLGATHESVVRPVQYERSVMGGSPNNAPGLIESTPQTVLAPPPNFQPSPITSVPSKGLIVDNIGAPPPVTFDDGATSGGWSFTVGGGTRSVSVKARDSSMPPDFSNRNSTNINETIVTARGGITVLIRDVTAQMPSGQTMELGTVELSADRIVMWTPLLNDMFSGRADLSQSPGEMYLEGDIVFRQGERTIYADRMYYNISAEKGVVLDAEAITTIPEYQGYVRLKAEVMQQIARGDFVAFDAAITSSRLGVPRYWLQSQQLRLNDRQRNVTNLQTGQRQLERTPWATSKNNFVYFGGVPIGYWPRFSTSLEYPAFYLTDAKFRNDNTFGTQALLDWDLFQVLGIENAPKGVDWELSTDYLSDRGPALGTRLQYRTPGFMGVSGPTFGFFDAWGIDDSGNDRLGLDRLSLEPEESFRGRAILRHRQYLANNYEFIAELGLLSDRNFLEQYLENEWDREKDHETGARLRRYLGSSMFDLAGNVQLNDFFMETEQVSLDHYVLGGSLGNLFTWSAHNRVGYARVNAADTPENAAEAAEYSPIPGEDSRSGIIASTQQELTMPVAAGPFKFVPFISGEAAHYGEASDGDSLTRLTGQAGLRMSLQMSKIDPTIQSSLMNVRGLAHKMDWTAEYFYADSDTNLDELPLYDPLDDNAQEQFRRRFIQDTFGVALPSQFDPRTYALRQGVQRSVTNPSDVITDDMQQFRLGLHQRWQTKRGLPGRERVVDLLQLDTDLIIFPDGDRDNFGETIGPATFDLRYHIGDRFTILSDGYYDFFDDGLRSVSAGLKTSRPGVSDWYIGLLSLEGPISSTVLRSSLDYRLNEKWIFSGGTTYDFGQAGNIGQSFGLTRVGESLLVRLGVNVDSGRDNVSAGFSVEPRFWPSRRMGRIGGKFIPPPGIEGLE